VILKKTTGEIQLIALDKFVDAYKIVAGESKS
jgi:hypothetical protein